MQTKVIQNIQDLTYLKWSLARSSSGTAGTFLKSQSVLDNKKTYYKLSNFDYQQGIIGHECVNEIIVDRLLNILGVEHLSYNLIHADIEIAGKKYRTWLCSSEDFKERGESKIALDDYYTANAIPGESHYDFCRRNGWETYIDKMLAVDYIILNRDRHGANIEVLRNARARSLRIAPLFDHGCSLLCSCSTEEEIKSFDVTKDRKCNNFIGGFSCFENLKLINSRKNLLAPLHNGDRKILFDGLSEVVSKEHEKKIWEMISQRYDVYENL